MSIKKISKDQPDIFEFNLKNIDLAKNIISNYPTDRKQSAVMGLLYLAQRQNEGWLSQKAIEKVEETLSMSLIRVMEVATFYSMFNLNPIGKNFIQICRTTPCWLRGSDKLKKIAKQINDYYYEDLNEENFSKILNDLKEKKPIKKGSQINRAGSEPKKK